MKKRIFLCDLPECSGQISIDDSSDFPYKKGWLYIKDLDIKVGKDLRLSYQDRHYCCLYHMTEDIKRGLEEKVKDGKMH